MPDDKIDQIIKEIFEPMLLADELPKYKLASPPSYEEIKQFAALIAEDKSEESFQEYIARRPKFLFRLAPSTDDMTIGFISKPPINNFNTADYAILSISQGGCRVFLIEIERPSDKLFTNKMTPAKKLQTAIGQIHDWKQWIDNNEQAFANTMLKLLKASPKFPKTSHNGSFIYSDKNKIDALWNSFGGSDYFSVEYLIVIGRWSQMNDDEQKRLMYLNRTYEGMKLRIRTYDNLVRKAIDGPKSYF